MIISSIFFIIDPQRYCFRLTNDYTALHNLTRVELYSGEASHPSALAVTIFCPAAHSAMSSRLIAAAINAGN